MATKVRGITIELSADASGVLKALQEVNKEVSSTSRELKDVDKLLKLDPTNTTLLTQKTQLLQEQIGNAESKLRTLKETQQNMQDNGVDENSEQYRALQREIEATTKQIETLKKTTGSGSATLANVSAVTGKWGNTLENAGQKMAGVSVAIGTGFGAAAKTAIDFETAFTGVKKTVDGTDDQLESIRQGIIDMSKETASSAVDIAGVAEAAGQLGIATDDVIDFTKVMVMLGDTTNLSADEAASALAKFANITGTSADDYERLGSVIVDLGNNYATTESDIVAMSTKLASAGTLAGLTEPEIFALATAMSSVGIEAEAGGTAMSQTMQQIESAVANGGEKLDKLANIAGMDAQAFADAWNNDPITALTAFIGGLGELDEQGESATLVLEDLGMKGIRQSNMLKALALASGMVTDAVGTANNAWLENSALSDEASKKYETTEAKMAQLRATFVELGIEIGDIILPIIRDAIEWIKNLVSGFNNLDDGTKKTIVTIAGMVAAISPLLIAGGKVLKGISSVTGALSKMGAGGTAGAIGGAIAGIAALSTVAVTLANDFINTTRESSQFYAGLQELAAANDSVSTSLENSKAAYDSSIEGANANAAAATSLQGRLNELLAVEDKDAATKLQIQTIVSELNELIPGLGLAYDENTGALNRSNDEITANIALMREQAQVAALQELYTETLKEQAMAQKNLRDATSEAVEVFTNYGLTLDDYNQKIADGYLGTDDFIAEMLSGKMTYEEVQQAIYDLTTSVDNLNDAHKNVADTAETVEWAEAQLNEATETLAQSQAELAAQMQEDMQGVADTATEVGGEIPANMAAAIEGGTGEVESATEVLVEAADPSEIITDYAETGSEATTELSNNISNGAGEVEGAANEIHDAANNGLNGLPDEMNTTGSNASGQLKTGLLANYIITKFALKSIADLFTTEFSNIGTEMNTSGRSAVQSLQKALSAGVAGVRSATNSLSTSISNAVAGLSSSMYNAGYNAGAGLYNGLSAWSGALYSQAWSIANSINAAARSALRIHSPSRVMAEIGRFVDEGLAEGMSNNASIVTDEAKAVADSVTGTMMGLDTDYNVGLKAMNAGLAANTLAAQQSAASSVNSMAAVLGILEEFLPYLAEPQDLRFDDGTWAGKLAPAMNRKFQEMQTRSLRA